MRYLTVIEVIELHERIADQSGGALGVRDLAGVEASVALPRQAIGGQPLYPGLIEKAAVLGFSLVMNHPFIDGNKRVGHAAMQTMLVLNGRVLRAPVDDQEHAVLKLAAGGWTREDWTQWVRERVYSLDT